VLGDALAHGLPGRRGIARLGALASILADGRKSAEMNFRSGCEAADVLAARLGMNQAVRDALACAFERWNGHGQPRRVKGRADPAADARRAPGPRRRGTGPAAHRGGDQRDPGPLRPGPTIGALVGEFLPLAAEALNRLDKLDPWDAALACQPVPRRLFTGAAWCRGGRDPQISRESSRSNADRAGYIRLTRSDSTHTE
jgi:hypothetical protein